MSDRAGEIAHYSGTVTAMRKPAPSREDHGWRSIAEHAGWILAVPRDEYLGVENGKVTRYGPEYAKANIEELARRWNAAEQTAALQAENERLRAEVEIKETQRASSMKAWEGCHKKHEELFEQVAALTAKLSRADALAEFTSHRKGCEYLKGCWHETYDKCEPRPCTCGLDAAFAAYRAGTGG